MLRPYLGVIGSPPDPDSPWDKRVTYYRRAERRRADRYHWTHLLPDVIKDCRKQLTHRYGDAFCPSHIVTAVSRQRSVIAQGVCASRAKQCLLLYQPGDASIENALGDVTHYLRTQNIDCTPAPISLTDRDSDLEEIGNHVARFIDNLQGEAIAFDLTPGYKSINFVLQDVVPKGSWFLYCRHRQLADLRVDPGSERYECWKKQ